ncbi:Trk system potassium transporter TrkA [Bartonella sp. TP]|uniref:Trk system potassium transporter TrkA n=1 Tax=Bartonella sp. TP TaxID=3057550 RepID=UPI0025B04597|nr:Trk system potassium transporter TrkA [Bartonella sp. TP]MDN5248840.1 Trk system potassium transporter TrkA [Alphaproteobacteria bacterium]WJW80086.1 Trk system potassium transporter TrkA [Bartonella sp. TP]
MHVIICGVGQVGYGIAKKLSAEEHDVTVIDTSPSLIENVCNNLDVRGITGHGAHPAILAAAGAADADMLVAVTYSDEINMIACQVAHSIFNIPTKIARIRAQAYLQPQYQSLFSHDHLPVDMVISPEIEIGQMVLKRVALQDANEVLSFANDNIVALGLQCLESCPVLSTPLRLLTELFPDLETTVVAIYRDEELFIANSNTELKTGDMVYLVTKREKISRVFGLFGHTEQKARRLIIAGGGHIGLYVAKMLEKSPERQKIYIIEPDKDRAEYVSEQLSKATVLQGSALDVAVLQEAKVEKADLIIGLTDQDQVNVLSAVLAKRLGCKANIALVNNTMYQEFNRALGVDVSINPRSITISRILQQMRRGRILAVHEMANAKAEIFEGEVLPASSLLGKSLKDLDLSKNLRIGAIYRDGEVIQPEGNTQIKLGDRVIIFALAQSVKEVEYLFRASLEYLKH